MFKRYQLTESTCQNLYRQFKSLHDPFPALDELLNRKCDIEECPILNKKLEVLDNEIKIMKLRCPSCSRLNEHTAHTDKELMMLMGEQIARTMSLNSDMEERYSKAKHEMAAKIGGFIRQFDQIDLEVKSLRAKNSEYQSQNQSLKSENFLSLS
jgi:hypothetical protein